MSSTLAAWPLTSLAQILTPISRSVPVEPLKTYPLLGMHWYAQGLYIKDHKQGSQIQATTLFQVKEGDFVYNRLFAWKGSFGIPDADTEDCYVSNEFPCFRVDETRAFPAFLVKYFSQARIWQEAQESSSGTTPTSRLRLKEEQLLAMEIPLPPLDEQRRIVARIDALASKIEEARGLRRGAGEEAARLITAATEAIFTQGRDADTALEELLREESLNGLSHYPSDSPPGVPILRISAGTSRPDAIVNETDYKYLDIEQTEIAKYKLIPGDLLACRFNGNLAFVGRFSLYQGYLGIEHVYPDKLIRFRVDTNNVYPEFVRIAMNSPRGRTAIEAFCATTAGNIGISAGKLKTIKIPIPTLDEQRSIVAYLDELQGKADALKGLQAEAAAELEALLPSVLDQAFRGEL